MCFPKLNMIDGNKISVTRTALCQSLPTYYRYPSILKMNWYIFFLAKPAITTQSFFLITRGAPLLDFNWMTPTIWFTSSLSLLQDIVDAKAIEYLCFVVAGWRSFRERRFFREVGDAANNTVVVVVFLVLLEGNKSQIIALSWGSRINVILIACDSILLKWC